MGVKLPKTKANDIFHQWAQKYDIFAPKLMEGEPRSVSKNVWKNKEVAYVSN